MEYKTCIKKISAACRLENSYKIPKSEMLKSQEASGKGYVKLEVNYQFTRLKMLDTHM